jgi:hypothetical protein
MISIKKIKERVLLLFDDDWFDDPDNVIKFLKNISIKSINCEIKNDDSCVINIIGDNFDDFHGEYNSNEINLEDKIIQEFFNSLISFYLFNID